jgi:hypothetical protein
MNEFLFWGPILLREKQRLLYLMSFGNFKLKCETPIVLNRFLDFRNIYIKSYNIYYMNLM